jgi:hypothetical protein
MSIIFEHYKLLKKLELIDQYDQDKIIPRCFDCIVQPSASMGTFYVVQPYMTSLPLGIGMNFTSCMQSSGQDSHPNIAPFRDL